MISYNTIQKSLSYFYQYFIRSQDRKIYGHIAKSAEISAPLFVSNPQNLFIDEFSRLQRNAKIINSKEEKIIIKKYVEIAYGLTIITGNHTPTVGIPQFLLGPTHINDKHTDIIIEDDVWIGANVTLLAGAHIGRGCIVGACSIVNKNIPPYAVVAGTPAHIIASKFSIEGIIRHEKSIYSEEERLSRAYLEDLFSRYFTEKKAIGIECSLNDKQTKILEQTKEKYKFYT